MGWKTYSYSSLWTTDEGVIKEPRIDVTLYYKGKSTTQNAIIDSGANITMINDEVASLLGIDKDACEKVKVGGIVGDFVESFCSKILIGIDGFEDKIEIPIQIIPGLNTSVLLGQEGVFDAYRIRFDRTDNTFALLSTDEETQHMENTEYHALFGRSLPSLKAKKK